MTKTDPPSDNAGIMEVKGTDGTVRLTNDELIITRRGIFSINTPDKTIALNAITAVELKRVGLVSAGYISFVFKGGLDRRNPFPYGDENTVSFVRKKQAAFLALQQAVRARLLALQNTGHTPAFSLADELEKLASLRDRQILSAEEFELKKKDLLAR